MLHKSDTLGFLENGIKESKYVQVHFDVEFKFTLKFFLASVAKDERMFYFKPVYKKTTSKTDRDFEKLLVLYFDLMRKFCKF